MTTSQTLAGNTGWRLKIDGWTLGTAAVSTAVMLPIVAVIILAFTPGDDIWGHLTSTVLPLYITTTVQLMIGVGTGTFFIGVGGAWLVTIYRFPEIGRASCRERV